MVAKLSKSRIECYVGYVVPLRLLSDANIKLADIEWSVDGDAVSIRSFADDEVHPFCDGIEYTVCREGGIRTYGGEEILTFNETSARFVKFEVLSTVGLEFERKTYCDATLHLGGLILMRKA